MNIWQRCGQTFNGALMTHAVLAVYQVVQRVKLHCALVRCGRDVCMLWIYFSRLIKLTVVFLVVCVTFSC